MADPRVPQGFLNRLNSAAYFGSLSTLNVTPPFLGKQGLSLRFGSKVTTSTGTMTGRVQSPEPYIDAMLTLDLLRTQILAALWQQQILTNSVLGDCVVYPDISNSTSGIIPFNLFNCAIEDPPDLPLNGSDPSFRLTVSAYMIVNSALWGGGP